MTCATAALAQTYPVKSVRIVLSSPGGGTDIMARLIADNLTRSFGNQFFVESRQPNVAAASFVARSQADGHVLLVSTASYLVNALRQPPPYDPMRDFAPVSLLGITPIIVVVHPSLPVTSLKGLIELARKSPGELNYGSGGISSPLHLAGELFNQTARVRIVHVPFKGTAHASTDLQAGRIQVMYPSTISLQPLITSGKAKVLAIMSERRSTELPAVPTTAEAGMPGLLANIWYGMLAPGGTPQPIVDRLNKEVVAALKNPDVSQRLLATGVEPVGNTPVQFAAFASAEFVKWKRVIDTAKIDLAY
ncbi:MAG: tripartite tricarboxylate transporter substrate binding protein [Pseudomonadota bacterium]